MVCCLDTVLKQSLADNKPLPATAALAVNQTTRAKTVTVRVAPPLSQEVQRQASGISSSWKPGNATALPAPAPASSWTAQATPVDGHIESDLLEFSSDASGQGSSPAKASVLDIPSSPPVSTFSTEAKVFTPARTTSSKQDTVDSPGDLEGGINRFLARIKQGSVSRLMRQKYASPQQMKASQTPHTTTAVVTPLHILDCESPSDSISLSAISSALEPTYSWWRPSDRNSVSPESGVEEEPTTPSQETHTYILEEVPELSFNPFGDQTEESDQRPSSRRSNQSRTTSIDGPIAALDMILPSGPGAPHDIGAVLGQLACDHIFPGLDNLVHVVESQAGGAELKPPVTEEITHSDHTTESLVNAASKTVEAPIDSKEARDTISIEAKAVGSDAQFAAPEPETQGPGAPTDVAVISAADLTSIPARADSPQQNHTTTLFDSKIYRTTSIPAAPVTQPQPPVIIYKLTETLPWSVKHVDAALALRLGVHRYRIYEAPNRGGFHDHRPEYLIQLRPSLAISTALPLPDRLQLEIVGKGSGPDGKGYFGEMSRIDTTKICEFCHKTHKESRCGFVQLVTDIPSRSYQGSLTVVDIVERTVKARKPTANAEESPEVHEGPTLAFDNSMVLDLDARAEEAQSTRPEDGVMPASASDPISQGWSSSPSLHTSDYTNVESIENEQLDSSLSVDAETGVASVKSPVMAESQRESAAGMPIEMVDAFVVMEMGEGDVWKEEMSLLD